jgi:hypothetical protein
MEERGVLIKTKKVITGDFVQYAPEPAEFLCQNWISKLKVTPLSILFSSLTLSLVLLSCSCSRSLSLSLFLPIPPLHLSPFPSSPLFLLSLPHPPSPLSHHLIQARYGVYGVLGNHDLKEAHSRAFISQQLRDVNVRVLDNEAVFPMGDHSPGDLLLVGFCDYTR